MSGATAELCDGVRDGVPDKRRIRAREAVQVRVAHGYEVRPDHEDADAAHRSSLHEPQDRLDVSHSRTRSKTHSPTQPLDPCDRQLFLSKPELYLNLDSLKVLSAHGPDRVAASMIVYIAAENI